MYNYNNRFPIFIVLMLFLTACGERDLTYDEFLANHVDAMGG